MNKKLILAAALLMVAATASISFLILEKKGSALAENPGQGATDGKIILFYGDGCPHCLDVENFLDQNEASKKITYEMKEVWSDAANRDLMMEKAAACGLTQKSLGVPFLWDGENGKCLMGKDQVINFFRAELNPLQGGETSK